jgi:hypothetical protein
LLDLYIISSPPRMAGCASTTRVRF